MAKKTPQTEDFISVIIPAYKAEKHIKEDLLTVKNVLDELRFDYEVICVVDGKLDSTYNIASEVAKKYKDLVRVVGYENNLGKGHAVRYGMAKSKGNIIGFIDAGIDIDPNGLSMLLEHFKWYDADIIVGSKRHPVSKVKYPWQRTIMSWTYQKMVSILFGLDIKDTQVGMKFFRREVLEETLPRLLVKQFAFDIEMLAVANYLGYKRIFEAPVDIDLDFSASTIAQKGFWNQIFNMMWDTLAVFYRLKILRFYDEKNKENWIASDYLTLNSK